MRLFDTGYLVAVLAFSLASTGFPVVQFLVHGNPHLSQCRGQGENQGEDLAVTPLMIIGVIFWFLLLVFTILLSLRTRKNLIQLRPQHLNNLPARNALTFLDTQIVCFLLLLQFMLMFTFHSMYLLNVFSRETSELLGSLTQMLLTNILLSLVFPVYIILKTRRYLPSLWDDKFPLIVQNNDFYAVRLCQISPHLEPEDETVM